MIKLYLITTLKRIPMDKEAVSVNQNVIYNKIFKIQNTQKKITLINDDFANISGEFDIFVCSAYKNDYVPLPRTVIGRLLSLGVDVAELAVKPRIDFKKLGVWISEETGNERFKRICCVELLDYNNPEHRNMSDATDILLKKTFATLRYAIEQAAIEGVATKRIMLPIPGVGSQGIGLSYIVPPLINQLTAILNTYDVDEITIFEINSEKALGFGKYLEQCLENKRETDVFISYSTKQAQYAEKIKQLLIKNDLSVWMAPDSIPPSEDYLDEIPNALANTKVVLLILTPDAELSKWVPREIATAIGANKTVIPCQLLAYDISKKFRFLLDGCQIYACYEGNDVSKELIDIINEKL